MKGNEHVHTYMMGQLLSDSATAGIHQQLIFRMFQFIDLFQLVYTTDFPLMSSSGRTIAQ